MWCVFEFNQTLSLSILHQNDDNNNNDVYIAQFQSAMIIALDIIIPCQTVLRSYNKSNERHFLTDTLYTRKKKLR